MFFIVCTIFWLTIVFASIIWPRDPAWMPPKVARGVENVFGEMTDLARPVAEKLCLGAPATCLEGAASLGRPVAGRPSETKAKSSPHSAVVDASAAPH
jgi:hypothetical protein